MSGWIGVFIGGGLGSLLRFGISVWCAKKLVTDFPFGTLISNFMACAVLALAIWFFNKESDNSWLKISVITGFCGGFSTFSTFSLETLMLFRNGQFSFGVANICISILSCLLVLYLLLKLMPK